MLNLILILTLIGSNEGDRLWKLIDQGKYTTVIEEANQYIKKGNVEKDVLLALAYSYRVTDSTDKAIKIYYKILSANPSDYDALSGLAFTLSWKGDLDSSIKVYKKLLKSYKNDREALMGIARVYGWKGDLKQAKKWIKKALSIYPDSPDVLKICGDIYTWDDRLKEAARCYEKAHEKSPKDVEIIIKLARTYEWMGDYKNSLKWYRMALSLDPQNKDAISGIKRIKNARKPTLSLKYSNGLEIDSTTKTRWNSMVLNLKGKLNRYLGYSIRASGYNARKIDTSRTTYFMQPGIIFTYNPFTLTLAPGFGTTNVMYSELSFKKDPVTLSAIYTDEILEDVHLIKIKHLELNGELDMFGFELKTGYDKGQIPYDNNSRVIFDFTLIRNLISNPVSLKILYSYGYKDYANWSPYYYSPSNFSLHSLGAMIFKSLGKGYIYADFSRSFYGQPQMLSTSAEAGFRNFYVSISYFETSENYSYTNISAGLTTRLGF